jgi:hypothetical protein
MDHLNIFRIDAQMQLVLRAHDKNKKYQGEVPLPQ